MTKRFIKTTLKAVLGVCLSLVAVLLILLIWSYGLGFFYDSNNIKYQDEHLEYLKSEYYTDTYVPCDEQKVADFDIEKACADGVKLNEIAVLGTHNSYQRLAVFPKRCLLNLVNIITFGKVKNESTFELDTVTQQLEQGIRNLEIDIETVDNEGDIRFIVTHDPIFDNATTCYDFEKALEEIALWSDHNPGHIPVYLLIEPKGDVPSVKNMKSFTIDYAIEFDKVIRRALGDKLLSPDFVLGEYDSFKEMRENDSWPALKDCMGKIAVLLHHNNITDSYIALDPSIRTQAMFPMLRFEHIDLPYTSFILENDPAAAVKNNKISVEEKKVIVRTRADDYSSFSDEKYKLAEACGSNIVSTDFPPRHIRPEDHTFTLGGYTIRLLK